MKIKKVVLGLLGVAVLATMLTGCNSVARTYGGTVTVNVPAGMKFMSGQWDEKHNFWYTTRPFHQGETPETYTVYEDSNYGILQGKVVVIEHSK